MPDRDNRPRFLSLFSIRLPVGAVASFAHRVSGVLLFLLVPFAVWLLDLSLRGEAGFRAAADLLGSAPLRLLSVVTVWALAHHLLAGIRFLIIDLGIGVQRAAARRSAWLANIGGLLAALAWLGGLL